MLPASVVALKQLHDLDSFLNMGCGVDLFRLQFKRSGTATRGDGNRDLFSKLCP